MLKHSFFLPRLCAALPALLITCAALAADAPVMPEYREASAQFDQLVQSAEAAKDPAPLNGQAAAALAARLGDDKHFIKPGVYSVTELKNLAEMCNLANNAVASVALFGVKRRIDPQGDREKNAKEIAALMDSNIIAFPAPLSRLQSFSLRCLAKEVEPLAEVAVSPPPDGYAGQIHDGLLQARRGMGNMFIGVLQATGDTRYDAAYRMALVQALAEAAPLLAQALPLPARAQLRGVLDDIKAAPPQFAPHIERIRGALSQTGCSSLCEL